MQAKIRALVLQALTEAVKADTPKLQVAQLLQGILRECGDELEVEQVYNQRLLQQEWDHRHPEYPQRDANVEQFMGVINELQRIGIIYIVFENPGSKWLPAPNHLVITDLGKKALIHELLLPLEAGFSTKLREACPDISDDVVARAEDATACLRHGLWRPTVVMLGVMFEEAIAQIFEDCDIEAKAGSAARNAGERLERFQLVVEHTRRDFSDEFSRTTDESYMEIVNLIAERIRRERNTAAHYGPDSNPEEEVDALVRHGMWALTEFWKYRQVLLDLDAG
jgi:hypothetical protein